MFYVRMMNGRLEHRPVSPYMGTAWYEARGWLMYAGSLSPSRITITGGAQDGDGITRGGTIVELPAPDPEPRTLSKLKLRDNLDELGMWDTLKSSIDADAEVSERWVLAQDVREDDADFVALKTQLAERFTASGRDLDEFLDQCILEA